MGNGFITLTVTHKKPWLQEYQKRPKKTKKPQLHKETEAFWSWFGANLYRFATRRICARNGNLRI
jgi:hypothetical protein